MASTTLTPTSIISSTGWSGVTAANLADNDGAFEATGGNPGEVILVELSDVPGDFGTSNHVNLTTRWNISGSASRAKSLLLEFLDSGNNVIESATFTTPSKSSPADTTPVSGNLSINQNATTLNGARLRITVQEGGGMGDSVTALVDYAAITLNYNVASAAYSIAGAVTVPTTIAATFDYTRNASIAGSVAVTLDIAAIMLEGRTLQGAVSVPLTIASGMVFGTGGAEYEIAGATSVSIGVAASITHNMHPSIAGATTIAPTVAATLAHNRHVSIAGATSVTIAPAATFVLGYVAAGDSLIPLTIASVMDYEGTGQQILPAKYKKWPKHRKQVARRARHYRRWMDA